MSNMLALQRCGAEDAVLRIEFSRPDHANSLTPALVAELADAIETATDARCIVLASPGKIFCAGADIEFLASLVGLDEKTIEVTIYDSFQRLILSIVRCPVPVVVSLQGPGVGAGADLALACDLRVASTKAWLEESWIRIGTISALGGTVILPAALGHADALDLLLARKRLDADRGSATGIFQEVVEPQALDDTVMRVANEIAALDTAAVQAMKQLVRGGEAEVALSRALADARRAQARLISSPTFGKKVSDLMSRLTGQSS